jgi:N-ethylmaleimide reductase
MALPREIGTDEVLALVELEATYAALVAGIAPLGIAYLSVNTDPATEVVRRVRKNFGGVQVANTGDAR